MQDSVTAQVLVMSITLDCPTCGRQLRLGDEHAGKRARCPACDTTFSVPSEKSYGIALDVADLEVDLPPRKSKRKANRAVAEQFGDKSCPNCGAGLVSNAVLCIDCGYDYRLQGQRQTESQLFEHSWDSGIGTFWRLIGMAILLGIIFIFSAVIAFFGRNLIFLPIVFVLLTIVFATLMGTYATFRVERSERGKNLLTRTQWLAFIPIQTTVTDLRKFERILIDHHAGFNLMGWVIFVGVIIMLLPGGCPAFFWWYWALTHPNFAVLLDNPEKGRVMEVYHAWSETKMRELVEMFKDLTNLPISRK